MAQLGLFIYVRNVNWLVFIDKRWATNINERLYFVIGCLQFWLFYVLYLSHYSCKFSSMLNINHGFTEKHMIFLWHVYSVWKSKHVAALEGRKTVIGSEIELQPLKWHEYNKALITQHVHYSLFIIQFGLELYVYVWRESKPKREREFCADYSV